MAYDRYDRDERSRWSDDRSDRAWRGDPSRAGRDDRGFWDRASDEVASWFGDEDAERRRHHDQMREREADMGSRDHGRPGERSAFGRGWGPDRDQDRGYGRDYDRDRGGSRDQTAYGGSRTDRDFNYDRGVFNRGGSSERDYNSGWRGNLSGSGERETDRNRDRERNQERNRSWNDDRESNRGSGRAYHPPAGDYGRSDHESDQFFAASGYGASERDRSQSPYGRDEYRRTSFAGSRQNDRDFDPHYRNWRDHHLSELDRDYDDYQRENQSRFENDFTGWREKRQHKRGLLAQAREHMEVVGSDDGHVGTIDHIAGDRIILTKSDPESGGSHHSLSCSDVDRVDGDKVILECKADEAKNRWRDESRSRALFEREDQGEMGPRNLNRSFEGTYR